MKSTILCAVLLLTAFFTFGPKFSLEAKHHRHHSRDHSHFSLNIGPMLSYPTAPAYVVERQPAYVEEHIYTDYYGNASYRERIYVQPQPVRYVYQPRPTFFSGFSFGFFR